MTPYELKSVWLVTPTGLLKTLKRKSYLSRNWIRFAKSRKLLNLLAVSLIFLTSCHKEKPLTHLAVSANTDICPAPVVYSIDKQKRMNDQLKACNCPDVWDALMDFSVMNKQVAACSL